MTNMKLNLKKIEKPEIHSEVLALLNLSIDGLNDLYLPNKKEFALRKKRVNNTYVIEGASKRYTLINLLGLYKAKCNGLDIKLDLAPILESQIKNIHKYKNAGNIGLLLWATSYIDPTKIGKVTSKINFRNLVRDFNDIKLGLSTELAWLLIGLLTSSTFNKNIKNITSQLVEYIYIKLRENYHGHGIFGHQATDTFAGKIRGEIGSFSDQVYSIYAFTLYSKLKQSEEALTIAEYCAKKICKYQDKYGAWAWHYNSMTGKVISKYPIYSVHQDAMAPLALFTLQKATGNNYEKYIYKGLDWLTNNEFNINMIDFENHMIKRAIAPNRISRKFKSLLVNLGMKDELDYSNVSVVDECWSYHLGWLLFAFSGRLNNVELISDSNTLIHNFPKIQNN